MSSDETHFKLDGPEHVLKHFRNTIVSAPPPTKVQAEDLITFETPIPTANRCPYADSLRLLNRLNKDEAVAIKKAIEAPLIRFGSNVPPHVPGISKKAVVSALNHKYSDADIKMSEDFKINPQDAQRWRLAINPSNEYDTKGEYGSEEYFGLVDAFDIANQCIGGPAICINHHVSPHLRGIAKKDNFTISKNTYGHMVLEFSGKNFRAHNPYIVEDGFDGSWTATELKMMLDLTQKQIDLEKVDPCATVTWAEHWMKVSFKLKESGYDKSAIQCRFRWEKFSGARYGVSHSTSSVSVSSALAPKVLRHYMDENDAIAFAAATGEANYVSRGRRNFRWNEIETTLKKDNEFTGFSTPESDLLQSRAVEYYQSFIILGNERNVTKKDKKIAETERRNAITTTEVLIGLESTNVCGGSSLVKRLLGTSDIPDLSSSQDIAMYKVLCDPKNVSRHATRIEVWIKVPQHSDKNVPATYIDLASDEVFVDFKNSASNLPTHQRKLKNAYLNAIKDSAQLEVKAKQCGTKPMYLRWFTSTTHEAPFYATSHELHCISKSADKKCASISKNNEPLSVMDEKRALMQKDLEAQVDVADTYRMKSHKAGKFCRSSKVLMACAFLCMIVCTLTLSYGSTSLILHAIGF